MFTHLPIITDDSYEVLAEKEVSAVFDKFICVKDGVTDLHEITENACREFKEHNPNLVKAIYSSASSIADTLESMGATHGAANLCGIMCLTNVLTLLRLIDRTLEAEELERQFRP